MKKGVLSLAIVLLVVLAVTLPLLTKTEIALWHMEQPPHRVEQFQKTIDAFNVKNPDIEAKQQVLDWMEAYTKVMAALQAG